MKKLILYIIALFAFGMQTTNAQIKKFGKVSADELSKKEDATFKNANAVVLFKKRTTHYDYDGERGFIQTTEIHERIKIYNKEGFDNATKKIRFYTGGTSDKEEVTIKAITYHLEGNKIIKTKLGKKDIFNKTKNKFWSYKNFTMPNLTNGCIVEWKYKIISPHLSIDEVIFQYDIPIKYMEAKINIPEYFIFNSRASKYNMISVKASKKSKSIDYFYYEKNNYVNMSTAENFNRKTQKQSKLEFTENIFGIKENNIEALKKEPHLNNINNYRGKIVFELKGTKYPREPNKSFSTDWNKVTKTIYNLESFGGELKKTNYFKSDLTTVLEGKTTRNEKINAIFNFVKSKVKWNTYTDYFTHNGVKKAYKNGSGNVAEINLMLTAMLREAGLDASPILVSTRSHGVPIFPTRDGFNYVISGIELPNQIILLDATDEYSSPDVLPSRVLNWQGRIIRKSGSSAFIDLFPKVYALEQDRLNVKLDNQGNITGSLRASFKNLNALTLRHRLNNLTEESLIKNLEEKYEPIEIEKVRLTNEKELDKPFGISLKFSSDNQGEVINDKIYFSPLFFLKNEENVFKADERKYPVDFASAWLDNFNITIQIPDGYKVEKLPDNATIDTENSIGDFSYTISKKENHIMLKVTTKINTSVIPNNLYQELKNFYTKKLLKMNEKVVLVKK